MFKEKFRANKREVYTIYEMCSESWKFGKIYVDGKKEYLTIRRNDRFWNNLLKMTIMVLAVEQIMYL